MDCTRNMKGGLHSNVNANSMHSNVNANMNLSDQEKDNLYAVQ